MRTRSLATLVEPSPQPGTGILHPFPTAELPHIDPFVFLDTGAPRQLGTGDIYVGPHAHRGVQPVSLVFRARIEHRDSLGNHKTVTSGGMQWLVSGSGAMHEEVLNGDDEGIFHMAQLWVNTRGAEKMLPAEHHAVSSEDVPLLTDLAPGVTFRLFAGEFAGVSGPAPLGTPVLIAHVVLDRGASLDIPVPEGWSAATTVVAGAADLAGHAALQPGATAVFADDGEGFTVSSSGGGEVLVMCGEPLAEPVVMGGGFVMNTAEEIDQAFADLRSGAMGELTPSR